MRIPVSASPPDPAGMRRRADSPRRCRPEWVRQVHPDPHKRVQGTRNHRPRRHCGQHHVRRPSTGGARGACRRPVASGGDHACRLRHSPPHDGGAAGRLQDRPALCVGRFARPGTRPHPQPGGARRTRYPGSRRQTAVRALARQSAGGDGAGGPDRALRQCRSRPAAPGGCNSRGRDKVDRCGRSQLGGRGSCPELNSFVRGRRIGEVADPARAPGHARPDAATRRSPVPLHNASAVSG